MRVIRAFVDRPLAIGGTVELPGDAAAHLVRVLRLREGDACVLFNGDGVDHDARLTAVGKRGASAEILASRTVNLESPLSITLVQGIARGDKMDWILQKATELGVAAFVPVSSDRSEVKLDAERAGKRHAHWRSVVVAACEQSWRSRIPDVAPPRSLAAALADLPADASRWLLDPDAVSGSATMAAPSGGIVLAIGPEGGWSANDRAALIAAGFDGLRLGPRILRTETAGMAAIAALQMRFGDLGG
ncbi:MULTISPECIES: 16S rRNA (uracil(1498)-N(3))-methyltransferase [Luteimonas]|uniref:16S rRNA (uracil(1498)-N(3))-methyltransferase n=1 Tax=Luteimonas TaxID=83614 RepID=UPI000C7AE080|nr:MULTISPECIES: 16S rRNA (uracil(1498)-N(3))-methyltransferase [Luteimonas]